jgi:hypothetical protein
LTSFLKKQKPGHRGLLSAIHGIKRSAPATKAATTPTFPPSTGLSSARELDVECQGHCHAESVRGEVPMHQSHLNYFPLPLIFYAIFAGVLLALFILLQLNLLRYAYMRIGLDSRVAMLVLLGSLLGSYINIPVAQLAEARVASDEVIESSACVMSCRSRSTLPSPFRASA